MSLTKPKSPYVRGDFSPEEKALIERAAAIDRRSVKNWAEVTLLEVAKETISNEAKGKIDNLSPIQ